MRVLCSTVRYQPIKAQGLLPADLETAIAAALREGQIPVDPFVTVTIAEYYSRPISVSGAVKQPILFQAEGPTTLLEAIARAQGLRENAGDFGILNGCQTQPAAKSSSANRTPPSRTTDPSPSPAASWSAASSTRLTLL